MNKIYRNILLVASLVLINSCSIAGSWVYERADIYLANYFNEYADFDKTQQSNIKNTTKEFHEWFTYNELPNVKSLLLEIKDLPYANSIERLEYLFSRGETMFNRTNSYFEKEFIKFAISLSDEQIKQIGEHFNEIAEKRISEIKENNNYLKSSEESLLKGFKRIGIKLRQDQRENLELLVSKRKDLRIQWSENQKKWTEELLSILNNRQGVDFDSKLKFHLGKLQDLGSEEFKINSQANQTILLQMIFNVFISLDENQIKKFSRTIDLYINSIERILSKKNKENSPLM